MGNPFLKQSSGSYSGLPGNSGSYSRLTGNLSHSGGHGQEDGGFQAGKESVALQRKKEERGRRKKGREEGKHSRGILTQPLLLYL